MKTWIKWTAATAGVLVIALVAAAIIGTQLAERKRNRIIDIKAKAVPIPTKLRRWSVALSLCLARLR